MKFLYAVGFIVAVYFVIFFWIWIDTTGIHHPDDAIKPLSVAGSVFFALSFGENTLRNEAKAVN